MGYRRERATLSAVGYQNLSQDVFWYIFKLNFGVFWGNFATRILCEEVRVGLARGGEGLAVIV